MNLFSLQDKVVVITGGTGVLGGSAANYLAQNGAKIALIGRNQEKLNSACKDIEANGGVAHGFVANILDKTSVSKVKDEVLAAFGQIDVLLNVAGGNMPGATIPDDKTVFDMSLEDFNTVTELNLTGTVVPSMVFGEVMAKQKKGSIINYSSMASDRAITRVVGYSASKAGMENFTQWMAVELAKKFGDGLRVNAIAPGFFIGNQNRRLLTNEDGSYTQRGNTIITNTPMGRFGDADELNGAIHYLATDASKFVTGIVLPIDGGFSAFSGV